MKYFLKYLSLWLFVLLPLTTHAELTGEVFFRHPDNPNELWITDVSDTNNARLLFKQKNVISKLSVQKNGHYIVSITEFDEDTIPLDIFLIEKNDIDKEERNLTHQKYTQILDVDVTQYGDVLFTNRRVDGMRRPENFNIPTPFSGIYLIPNREIENPTIPTPPFIPPQVEDKVNIPMEPPTPRAMVIKYIEANRVAISPDRKQIAYDTDEGVFMLYLATGEVTRVRKGASFPTFSPDGKKLAFVYRSLEVAVELEVVSAETLRFLGNIKYQTLQFQGDIEKRIIGHQQFLDFKFSPDGKYLVYTTYGGGFFNPNTSFNNYAISLDGKEQFKILDGIFDNGVPMFDWVTSEVPYNVEPKNRLTTLWGKLKQ